MVSGKMTMTALLVLLVFVSSCGSGERILADVDPEAAPLDPDFELVFNIMQRDCVPCHRDGDGDGEPPAERGDPGGRFLTPSVPAGGVDPDLSSCSSIVENRFEIIDQVINRNEMPPGAWPRLTSEEKLTIQRWVQNGAQAPCQ